VVFDPSRVVADKYILRQELGRGGSCVVSEAIHRFTGRVVAVKQLLAEMRQREDVRARLFREAEALGAIRHPNVVDVLDAGEEEGVPYVVLERVHGRTLVGFLAARSRLDVRASMNIAWQTCAALAAAHAAGVVHRDVKPENIVICGEDPATARIKLIDFGIATAPRGANAAKITRAGSLVGTAEYMPPELLGGGYVPTPAADLYAVGVTLYECLSGRVPITGNAREIRDKLARSPPPPVEAFRKDVPKSLAQLIARALAKDPERRFPSAQSMAEALEQVASELLPKNAPAVSARPSQPQIRSSRPELRVPREIPLALRSEPARIDTSRRRTRRAPYRTPVRLEFDTGSFDARSEDLSRDGMFVLVLGDARPPGIGARTSARFALPSTGEIVTVHGVVRWMKPREHGAVAVGFEFVAMETRVREAIEQFVEILGRDVED
jgi:serine/threonine-protein kinase